MKSKLWSLLLAAALLFCFSACTASQSQSAVADTGDAAASVVAGNGTEEGSTNTTEGEETTIVFWNHLGDVGDSGAVKKSTWYDEQIAIYEAENPGIKVVQESIPMNEYMSTKLSVAFATGEAPDVFLVSSAIILQYMNAGVLADLSPYIAPEVKADFAPAAFDGLSVGDSIYAIPFEQDLFAMFCDRGALQEAGYDVPTTWDELIEISAAVTTDTRWGFTVDVEPCAQQLMEFAVFVWQQGNFFENGKSALNSKAVVDALQLWKDLMDSGGLNQKPSTLALDSTLMFSGETVMQVSGPSTFVTRDEEYPDRDIVAVHFPTPEDGTPASIGGGWKYVVNNESEHVDEAAKFVSFLSLDSVDRCVNYCTDPTFTFTPRASVIEAGAEVFAEGDLEFFANEIVPITKPELAIPAELTEILYDMIQDAWFNMSAQEAADRAHQRANEFLEGYDGILPY
jgi:multiple sugar transport system substrate-binding protein